MIRQLYKRYLTVLGTRCADAQLDVDGNVYTNIVMIIHVNNTLILIFTSMTDKITTNYYTINRQKSVNFSSQCLK